MRPLTITAVDVGTQSVKILVGEKPAEAKNIAVLGQVKVPCFGVRKAEVVESSKVAEAIGTGLDKLKERGVEVEQGAWVNVGGSHVYGLESQGLISVSRADQTISEQDVERVLQASKAVNLASNKEVVDIYPQQFIVDGEGGIADPAGLQGVRLEVKVLLVCAFSPVLENLAETVEQGGLDIEEMAVSALASARACLTPQQKELGCVVVDIGADTTDLAFFDQGRLIDLAVFPVGAANITNDIAIGMRTEIATAETIKKDFIDLTAFVGKKTKGKAKKSQTIKMPEHNLAFPRNDLEDIVEARVSQIFAEVAKKIEQVSERTLLPGGVVLCGGGALMPGIVEYAKQELELPARLGKPQSIENINDPCFATAAGLALSGFDQVQKNRFDGALGQIGRKLKKAFKIFVP